MEKLFDLAYTEGPINIGLDKTISIKELGELISEQAEINTTFNFNLNKPEGRFVKSSDIKLQQSLIPDFTPKITLKKGVLKMIDWYKKSEFKKLKIYYFQWFCVFFN